jgi:hypothetical protein
MTPWAWFVEGVGIVSFLLNVWGNLLLTRKSRHGWVVRIIAIVCWGFYGGFTASVPMLLNAVTFFGINVYGWRKWRAEERAARWHDEHRRLA